MSFQSFTRWQSSPSQCKCPINFRHTCGGGGDGRKINFSRSPIEAAGRGAQRNILMSSDAGFRGFFRATRIYFHSPQSEFLAGSRLTRRYLKSFFNFSWRLRILRISFSIHSGDGCTGISAGKLSFTAVVVAVYIATGSVHVLLRRSRVEESNFVARGGSSRFVYIFFLSLLWIFLRFFSPTSREREPRARGKVFRLSPRCFRLSRSAFINAFRAFTLLLSKRLYSNGGACGVGRS